MSLWHAGWPPLSRAWTSSCPATTSRAWRPWPRRCPRSPQRRRRRYSGQMPMDDIAVSDEVRADPPAPPARSNRGFWVVTGALVLGCMFMLVEIFANFGTKDTIAHAEHTLRAAQAAAERVHEADGTYGGADHTRLSVVEPTLTWLPGTENSGGLDQV